MLNIVPNNPHNNSGIQYTINAKTKTFNILKAFILNLLLEILKIDNTSDIDNGPSNDIATTDISEDPFKDFGDEVALSDDDLPF